MSAEEQKKLDSLLSIQKIVAEGYAGMMPNGNLVDRREHTEAIPLQENSLLGIPKPNRKASL